MHATFFIKTTMRTSYIVRYWCVFVPGQPAQLPIDCLHHCSTGTPSFSLWTISYRTGQTKSSSLQTFYPTHVNISENVLLSPVVRGTLRGDPLHHLSTYKLYTHLFTISVDGGSVGNHDWRAVVPAMKVGALREDKKWRGLRHYVRVKHTTEMRRIFPQE